MKYHQRLTGIVAVIVALVLLLGSLSACAQAGKTSAKSSLPSMQQAPAAPDLSTPKTAVRAYLDWTSFAYYIADSEVATPTMSPYEEVRVNSYVQLNLESGRRINQRLDSLKFVSEKSGETTATVVTKESWTYRYLAISADQSGAMNAMGAMGGMGSMVSTQDAAPVDVDEYAKYDVTYTLVKEGKNWVVDSVDAKATTTVK